MFAIETTSTADGFVSTASDKERSLDYVTYTFRNREDAEADARRWIAWFEAFPTGKVESIYYILAVPETWPGPHRLSHGYSGLFVKIGRTNDLARRLQNLRTGTSVDLVVHALEPGGAELEAQRHREFAEERRQGEWFSCSPKLMNHMFDIWTHYRTLPREHQEKVLALGERVKILRATREVFQGAPDMINPSLNEPWHGTVLIDTTIMQSSAPRTRRK